MQNLWLQTFFYFIEIIQWNEFWLKQSWVVITLTHHRSSKRNNSAHEAALLVAFNPWYFKWKKSQYFISKNLFLLFYFEKSSCIHRPILTETLNYFIENVVINSESSNFLLYLHRIWLVFWFHTLKTWNQALPLSCTK